MGHLVFAEPWWFLLLGMLLPMFYAYRQQQPAMVFPSTARLAPVRRSRWIWARHLLFTVRAAAVALLVSGLARPQIRNEMSKRRTEGIDIMFAIDTSGSMKALDFTLDGKRQNRLQVLKTVMSDFIRGRPDDRLGMVVFGSSAFAGIPLTLDHDVLLNYVDFMTIGMAGDATAIGDAIGVAANRLKDLKAKSRIIILLTDGDSNAGKLDPLEAAAAAKTLGIKVYTIGIGSNKMVPFPTAFGYQNVQVRMDEKALRDIAQRTDAQYFNATDTESLRKVYKTIDALERSSVEIQAFQNVEEKFAIFVWPGLLLLLLELGLGLTRLRRLP